MGMRVCYEGEGRRFGFGRGLVVAWVCSFAGVRLSTFLWSLLVVFYPIELADLNYVEKYHVKLYLYKLE